MVPQKEITIKITESNPSPTNVDRIVLTHNFFPFVATFNLDKIIEFCEERYSIIYQIYKSIY